ncbi:hypothetical protein E1B28_010913 [Marasmius oreades]|uniref:Zn(2)-C6 fungal-type domain-containing protein n=1 Tax=Marasmius oreades TaxID=181124 RepID=A0A9P7RU18_9AGAR|nr:uncharacterized protein E1B28_010913 [Marasmius oreades]KAG7089211.1 hypothetical protein E1B28_010913 [Marasmius oreades]
MDKIIQASQIFARALYPLRRGCALWIPEPNNELSPEYCAAGVQIGDVGILRADGSFDFVFNVCRSADDPVNQYGVPDNFQPLSWNGAKRRTHNIFRPGEPVLSRGAEKRTLGVEGTALVPGIPVGGGAGFSIRFSQDRGAVILPPNGADSVDCQNLAVFRKYAERYSISWYKFVNETLGMEIENGAIYFVTGFDKTNSWENAVFNTDVKERTCEIFVNTGSLPGGAGRLELSDSSLHETFSTRCSPSDNDNHNQALFIRGFRISIPHKLKAFFGGSGVEVTSTYESSWRDALGKKGSHFPYNGGDSFSRSGLSSLAGSASFAAGPPSPSSESEATHTTDEAGFHCDTDASYADYDSDTSVEEDDIIPALELYHPLKAINDYILRSVADRHDIKVVITHDEDWIALVTDQDTEMPDESTLIRRLQQSLRITVENGCAFLDCREATPSKHPNPGPIFSNVDNYHGRDASRCPKDDNLPSTSTRSQVLVGQQELFNTSPRNKLFNDTFLIGEPFVLNFVEGNHDQYEDLGHNRQKLLTPPYDDAPTSHVLFPPNSQSDRLSDPESFTRRSEFTDKRHKPGACARCKNLKVRCEFKSDTDPCKRCLNGGHECVIPSRKKRRRPPKREHLLAEIQKQAETIEKLMAQLAAEEGRKGSVRPSLSVADTLVPPIFTPSTGSHFSDDSYEIESPVSKSAVIEDWNVKARDSLAQFGGFIGVGGGSLPTNNRYDVKVEPGGTSSGGDVEEDSSMSEEDSPYNFHFHKVGFAAAVEEDTKPPDRRRMSKRILQPRKRQRIGNRHILQGTIHPSGSHRIQFACPDVKVEEDGTDFANVDISRYGLDLEKHSITPVPGVLADGVLTPQEAEELFALFFDTMNPSVSLVDPVLYTPQRTGDLSPFLFTVICAIASKYYEKRPGLHEQAMSYAEASAGRSLLRGQKNVEMCMAYILLSLYPPLTRQEDSRSYLYLGVAIRIATELGLHLPPIENPTNEVQAREQLNRTRVWLNCFNLDCFTSLQHGQRPSISSADYIANRSENWWASSEYNMRIADVHLCCYTELMKDMAKFMEKRYSNLISSTAVPKVLNGKKLAADTCEELRALQAKWSPILEANVNKEDAEAVFRADQLESVYRFSFLIALSYGFHQAAGQDAGNDQLSLFRFVSVAVDVIESMIEQRDRQARRKRIYVPYGLDTESFSVTSAAEFLVKILQPNYSCHLDDTTRVDIGECVQSAIACLNSPGTDPNERQGYKKYAKLLQELLASLLPGECSKHDGGAASLDRVAPQFDSKHVMEQSGLADDFNVESKDAQMTLRPGEVENLHSLPSSLPSLPTLPLFAMIDNSLNSNHSPFHIPASPSHNQLPANAGASLSILPAPIHNSRVYSPTSPTQSSSDSTSDTALFPSPTFVSSQESFNWIPGSPLVRLLPQLQMYMDQHSPVRRRSVAVAKDAIYPPKRVPTFFCTVPGCTSKGFAAKRAWLYHMRSH